MRTVAVTATALALVVLAACGSDPTDPTDTAGTATSTPSEVATTVPSVTAPSSAAPKPATEATAAQVQSVADDVQEYAVALEQVFFGSGYPSDLAGARATAAKLTNLSLSAGNTIASYRFDPDASEFQLCVDNSSGAWATYDTEPMSTIETGKTGGCP
ncbi:MAG: hypothetical protein NTV23_11885 [Propionibacteriales bacterium]|nr:hypothetical protein [Propionibacteriales bacterium]